MHQTLLSDRLGAGDIVLPLFRYLINISTIEFHSHPVLHPVQHNLFSSLACFILLKVYLTLILHVNGARYSITCITRLPPTLTLV